MNIKIFHEYKTKAKLKSYFRKQIFLFFKYLFLIIFSSDWIIIENKGIYGVFGKLTIINLMKKLQINFSLKLIGILIFTITFFSIISISLIKCKFEFIDYDNFVENKYKKLIDFIFYFFQITYFILFNYTIEIIMTSSLEFVKICNFQNFETQPLIINNNFNNCKSIFNIETHNFIFGTIFLLIAIMINYLFYVFFVSIYSVDPLDYNEEFESFDKSWMFLIIINIFTIFDIYLQINIYMFYVKLAIRILYVILFIFQLKKNFILFDKTELFLKSYCFFSCISELIIFKNFLSNLDFGIDIDILNFSALNLTNETLIKFPILNYYTGNLF